MGTTFPKRLADAGITFPADFPDVVGFDGLFEKRFPGSVGDAKDRGNTLAAFGCNVIEELATRLKGRYRRKAARLRYKQDYEALWTLEVRQIPNIVEVARALTEEMFRDPMRALEVHNI